jgi:hypothetical protein
MQGVGAQESPGFFDLIVIDECHRFLRRWTKAEHREILRNALTRPPRRSFVEVLASMPDVGTDEDFARYPNSA